MALLDLRPEDYCEAHVINGKALSKKIRKEIGIEVERLTELHSIPPKLVTVIVGDNPASQMYVRMKHKACKRVGILSEGHNLPEDTTQDELLNLIRRLNTDPNVHGILVQLPLPKHIDEETIISAIHPDKDVDGFSPQNIYRLFYGSELLSAATPQGIVTMLDHLGIDLAGMHAVIVNRSTIVGKPLIMLLLNRNITVTVAHSRTKDLPSITRQADILISAVGRRTSVDDPYFITADMVKEGAIVIDVASPFGDCDFEAIKCKAAYITPVPGGVGPMTIAMLLKNVLAAYSFQMARTNILTSDAIGYGLFVS
ncbi:MAG: bifunctional 5,10-methylenetetrahydrofolate dehydrogenase/5,10-methenyltetrahydrofolate cyclohydrolase [Candidatus Thorarchaeota archaeon]|nr:bifunctional 5,10-methylenetetrahydrofolate dehydrogenase/5,10-methenyltetrahydrofolate cyclohydrolase [Candidatus Thorarchaeota archaeon]